MHGIIKAEVWRKHSSDQNDSLMEEFESVAAARKYCENDMKVLKRAFVQFDTEVVKGKTTYAFKARTFTITYRIEKVG